MPHMICCFLPQREVPSLNSNQARLEMFGLRPQGEETKLGPSLKLNYYI